MAARLVALAGPLEGALVPLDDVLSIGRGPENQLVIPDLGLSRSPCRIDVVKGRFVLHDLHSRNLGWRRVRFEPPSQTAINDLAPISSAQIARTA
jgi:FHA domain